MVSDRKITFFKKRVEAIVHQKELNIKQKWVDKRTDYLALIGQGKGQFLGEAALREMAKKVPTYELCDGRVSLVSLFSFRTEHMDAEMERMKIDKQRDHAKSRVKELEKQAYDTVYLGSEQDMIKALKALEGFKI